MKIKVTDCLLSLRQFPTGTNTPAHMKLEEGMALGRRNREVLFLPGEPKYTRNQDTCGPGLTLPWSPWSLGHLPNLSSPHFDHLEKWGVPKRELLRSSRHPFVTWRLRIRWIFWVCFLSCTLCRFEKWNAKMLWFDKPKIGSTYPRAPQKADSTLRYHHAFEMWGCDHLQNHGVGRATNQFRTWQVFRVLLASGLLRDGTHVVLCDSQHVNHVPREVTRLWSWGVPLTVTLSFNLNKVWISE